MIHEKGYFARIFEKWWHVLPVPQDLTSMVIKIFRLRIADILE